MVALVFLLALAGSPRTADSAYPGPNGHLSFSCLSQDPPFTGICSALPGGGDYAFLVPDDEGGSGSSWSPDGSRLAVSVEGVINVVDPDGSNRVPLGPGTWPSWSPEGDRIAYVCIAEGRAQVCVMNDDGTGKRVLTNPADLHSNLRPSWSPSGDVIVFDRSIEEGGVIKVSERRLATIQPNAPAPQASYLLPDVYALCADVSPDGETIAFWSTDPHGVYTVDADGSDVQLVLSLSGITGNQGCRGIAWAPEGDQIAFGCLGDICTVKPDGTGFGKLIETPGAENEPDWRPHAGGPQTFAYRMPARFGLDEDGDGLIDYHDSPENVQLDTYQVVFTVTACDTDAQYDWEVDGEPLPVESNGCEFTADFDQEGVFEVTLRKEGTPLSTKPVTVQDWLIVSLGDSAASGEGTPDKRAEGASTAVWQDRDCHRSALSAPALAAKAVEDRDPRTSVTFVHLACSGAKILGDLVPGTNAGDDAPHTQLAALQALAGAREIDAILLQAGANDIGFGHILNFCARYENCDNAFFSDEIEVLSAGLGLGLPVPVSPLPVQTFVCGANPAGSYSIVVHDIRALDTGPIRAGWDIAVTGEEQAVYRVTGVKPTVCQQDPLAQSAARLTLGRPLQEDYIVFGADPLPNAFPVIGVPLTLDAYVSRRISAELPPALDDIGGRLGALAPRDRLFAVEYFDPATGDNGETCDEMLAINFPPFIDGSIDRDEAKWSRFNVVDRLNTILQQSAERNGWQHLGGIAEAFVGHGYCAGDAARWIRLLSESIQYQVDVFGTMHPNEAANAFIAGLLEDELVDAFYALDGAPRPPVGDRAVTALSTPATTGDTWIDTGGDGSATSRIGAAAKFAPGDTIVINPGGPNEEFNLVVALGSLLLEQPLLHDHEAGEPVIKAETAFTVRGDATCDLRVDIADALAITRGLAGLPTGGCTDITVDLDCDQQPGANDLLLLLFHLAGIPAEPGESCAGPGVLVPVPPASP